MQTLQDHSQWNTVKDVCRRLKENGHEALLAGGCVRDLLMKREPHDFDIATSATPDEVEALFPKALGVGKAFGVMILPFDGFQLEVATFREDLDYKDGRRPEGVKFSSPEADAQRRDFTCNALFLDPDTGNTIDYVGGIADIQRRVIRTVGEAQARFQEDKLRLLRAVRFSSQLDFEIDPITLEAICRMAPEASVVSRERVRDELLKLLKSPLRVKGLRAMADTGLMESLFPSAHAPIHQRFEMWISRFERYETLFPGVFDQEALLALYFEPVALALANEKTLRDAHLKDVRFDNKRIDHVLEIFRTLPIWLGRENVREGRMIELLAGPIALSARRIARVLDASADTEEREKKFEALAKRVLSESMELPEAWLSGVDAKNAGFAPGRELGESLREAYLLQLEGKLASKDEAVKWLKSRALGARPS